MSGTSVTKDTQNRSLGFVNNPPRGYFRTLKTAYDANASGGATNAAVVLAGSPQLLDVSGGDTTTPIDVMVYATIMTNGAIGGSSTDSTHALPDGKFMNQLKMIRHMNVIPEADGKVTVTSAKLAGGTQLSLDLELSPAPFREFALLIWTGTQWVLIDKSSTTAVLIGSP